MSTALGILGGKRRRRRLQLAALVEDFDAPLGLFEPPVAEARELHAALVQCERLLEREVAFLVCRDEAERMHVQVRGLLFRLERHETNVVRLADLLQRPTNARVAR